MCTSTKVGGAGLGKRYYFVLLLEIPNGAITLSGRFGRIARDKELWGLEGQLNIGSKNFA